MCTVLAQDLESNLGRLAKHIKNYCDVKTVKDMVQENERLNKQIVEDLVKIVDKKNDMVAASHTQFVTLQNMVADVEALRLKAEEEKRNMEAQHKRGSWQSICVISQISLHITSRTE